MICPHFTWPARKSQSPCLGIPPARPWCRWPSCRRSRPGGQQTARLRLHRVCKGVACLVGRGELACRRTSPTHLEHLGDGDVDEGQAGHAWQLLRLSPHPRHRVGAHAAPALAAAVVMASLAHNNSLPLGAHPHRCAQHGSRQAPRRQTPPASSHQPHASRPQPRLPLSSIQMRAATCCPWASHTSR